ncbi:MAG: hypothetical protein LBR88_01445 [Zoogloeaceae bacterium]|jgi:hypothetical protein|nr:hypothetical protein [Zoogloeaceae bacterium]
MNPKHSFRKNILPALLALALATLLGVGQFLYRRPAPEIAPPQTPSPSCELNRTPCRVPLAGGGEARVEFMPRPIPLLAPFTVQIHLKNRTADQARLEFIGGSMDMGFNQTKLRQETPGVFNGRATLPVCSVGAMRWQAVFTLIKREDARETQESFTLPFVTGGTP